MNDSIIEVKYNNDFNLLPMPKLSGRQMDLFYTILSHTNEDNQTKKQSFLSKLANFWNPEKREIQIPINEFVKTCRADKWNRSFLEVVNDIENFFNLILNYKVFYEDERKKYAFVCFEKAEWDKFEQTISIVFQEDFYKMVIDYKLGFTKFDLREFIELSSEYSKTLYRYLKQFRTQGWWKVRWDDFRNLMKIPPKYKISDIDKRILTPAIKELSEPSLLDPQRIPFKNLTYTKIKGSGRGRGGSVIGIQFTWVGEIETSSAAMMKALIGKKFVDRMTNKFGDVILEIEDIRQFKEENSTSYGILFNELGALGDKPENCNQFDRVITHLKDFYNYVIKNEFNTDNEIYQRNLKEKKIKNAKIKNLIGKKFTFITPSGNGIKNYEIISFKRNQRLGIDNNKIFANCYVLNDDLSRSKKTEWINFQYKDYDKVASYIEDSPAKPQS